MRVKEKVDELKNSPNYLAVHDGSLSGYGQLMVRNTHIMNDVYLGREIQWCWLDG